MFGLLNIILTFTSCNNAVVYLTLTDMNILKSLLKLIGVIKVKHAKTYIISKHNDVYVVEHYILGVRQVSLTSYNKLTLENYFNLSGYTLIKDLSI